MTETTIRGAQPRRFLPATESFTALPTVMLQRVQILTDMFDMATGRKASELRLGTKQYDMLVVELKQQKREWSEVSAHGTRVIHMNGRMIVDARREMADIEVVRPTDGELIAGGWPVPVGKMPKTPDPDRVAELERRVTALEQFVPDSHLHGLVVDGLRFRASR